MAGYDVGTADYLALSVAHSDQHIEPNGIDSQFRQRPTPFQVNSGTVSYLLNLSRLSFEPFVTVAKTSYSDVRLGNTIQVNNYLDNTAVTEGVTTRYELSPLHHAVFVVRGTESDYNHSTAGAISRNNSRVSVLGGLDYVASGVWRYRVLVGYQFQQYTSSAATSQATPIVEGNVIWTPTLLTSVELTANREIRTSTDPLTASYTDSFVKLQVEHEYKRNLLFNVHVSTEQAEYQQNGGHQTLVGVGAGSTWLLNRNQRVVTTYDHTKSLSNTRQKFDEDVFLVRFSVGF